jgi:hypothetical protein
MTTDPNPTGDPTEALAFGIRGIVGGGYHSDGDGPRPGPGAILNEHARIAALEAELAREKDLRRFLNRAVMIAGRREDDRLGRTRRTGYAELLDAADIEMAAESPAIDGDALQAVACEGRGD